MKVGVKKNTKSEVRVLSYGAGVNSTAILALAKLSEIDMPDYIVFSDTGCEYPDTYQYMDYLEEQGIHITYLTGGIKNMTLLEWCKKKSFIPSRMNRWCTDYWKIRPVHKFIKSLGDNVTQWIGIDAGEAHRAKGALKRNKNTEFPLIEKGINRNQCKAIIRKAGLGVPRKSGCYICPYQRKQEWINLKKHYPELWKIAVDLEKQAIVKSEGFTYKQGMTIEEYVGDLDKQEELELGFVLDQKCACRFQ